MPRTSYRRIVRRAVLAIVAVVLLPVGYAGSVATLIYLLNTGIVPLNAATQPQVFAYIAPYWWYMESGWPGARNCDDLVTFAKKAGQRAAGREL